MVIQVNHYYQHYLGEVVKVISCIGELGVELSNGETIPIEQFNKEYYKREA